MKGVAIPYIIALILGIIVIGVLGYWFLLTYGESLPVIGEGMCRSKLISYCTDLQQGRTSVDFFAEYAQKCEPYKGKPGWPATSPTVDECKKIVGF